MGDKPTAAIGNDSARAGIIVCLERLQSMGIAISNIFIYDLAFLLSDGYKRTYSGYVDDIPIQIRLLSVEKLSPYDFIVFCGGNALVLLNEINRTGFSMPLKQVVLIRGDRLNLIC